MQGLLYNDHHCLICLNASACFNSGIFMIHWRLGHMSCPSPVSFLCMVFPSIAFSDLSRLCKMCYKANTKHHFTIFRSVLVKYCSLQLCKLRIYNTYHTGSVLGVMCVFFFSFGGHPVYISQFLNIKQYCNT